jgi:hypothetical protein
MLGFLRILTCPGPPLCSSAAEQNLGPGSRGGMRVTSLAGLQYDARLSCGAIYARVDGEGNRQ